MARDRGRDAASAGRRSVIAGGRSTAFWRSTAPASGVTRSRSAVLPHRSPSLVWVERLSLGRLYKLPHLGQNPQPISVEIPMKNIPRTLFPAVIALTFLLVVPVHASGRKELSPRPRTSSINSSNSGRYWTSWVRSPASSAGMASRRLCARQRRQRWRLEPGRRTASSLSRTSTSPPSQRGNPLR